MSAALGLLLLLSLNPQGLASGSPAAIDGEPARLTSFAFLTIPSEAYAGEQVSVVIEARDEFGARFPYNGAARLSTTSDDNFVYVTPSQVSFVDGRCSTAVTFTLAEQLQLRCSDPGNLVSSLSEPVNVLPGAPRRFLVVLPGEELAPGSPTGRSRLPDAHLAGDTFSIQVYLTDSCHNVIQFRNDSFLLGSTDRFGLLPSGGRLANGTALLSVRLRTAGAHRIIAAAGTTSPVLPDTSSPVTIFAGAFDRLLLLLPGEVPLPGDTTTVPWQGPGKTGEPEPQYLSAPFPVRILPCDACWNRVTGPADTVTVQSDFPVRFVPASAVLLDSAVFRVQFDAVGTNQNIRALDLNTAGATYWSYVDVRALGSRFDISAPDTVRAGETAHVAVTVLDANGAPVTAARVDFAVTAGGGRMLDAALLTDTVGFCRARFLCDRGHFSEHDTIRIVSGDADTLVGIFVSIPDSSIVDGRVIAYPNPFGNPADGRTSTIITYYLPSGIGVTLRICDPFGNEVLTRRYTRNAPGARAGVNQVTWDGRNQQGRRVASGIYVVQVVGTIHTGIEYRASTRIGVIW
jgi:hypothetical protein